MFIVTCIDEFFVNCLYSKSITIVTFLTGWSLVSAGTTIHTRSIGVLTLLWLQTVSTGHDTIFSIKMTVTGYYRTRKKNSNQHDKMLKLPIYVFDIHAPPLELVQRFLIAMLINSSSIIDTLTINVKYGKHMLKLMNNI